MDQMANEIRHSNWIRIIRECQDRPAGMTAKQWMADNGISDKSYYYWLHKLRKEASAQIKHSLPVEQEPDGVTFLELPAAMPAPLPAAQTAAVRIGGAEIVLSETISDEFLIRILKAAHYAG